MNIEVLTPETLKLRQALPLSQKIDWSVGVIEQFIARTKGKCYVSFSGGKDSTVLLDLCRMVKPDIKVVFCNTRNEYPDIVKFVRSIDNIEIIYPDYTPKEVFNNYGFPLVSKSISHIVDVVKRNPTGETYKNNVLDRTSNFRLSDRWLYLINEPYNITDKCCYKLKKEPFKKYEKKTGLLPILGTMAAESNMRTVTYLNQGSCNAFDKNGNPLKSLPLSIWTEQDIWDYIELKKLKIADIYNKGAERTGCMFCGYGCQFKKDNRLKLIYELYPKWYNKFMSYENNGTTYKEAMRKLLATKKMYLPDEQPPKKKRGRKKKDETIL